MRLKWIPSGLSGGRKRSLAVVKLYCRRNIYICSVQSTVSLRKAMSVHLRRCLRHLSYNILYKMAPNKACPDPSGELWITKTTDFSLLTAYSLTAFSLTVFILTTFSLTAYSLIPNSSNFLIEIYWKSKHTKYIRSKSCKTRQILFFKRILLFIFVVWKENLLSR